MHLDGLVMRVGVLALALGSVCSRGRGQALLVGDAHGNAALPNVNSGGISNVNVGGGYTGLLQFDLSLLPAGTSAAQVTRAVLVVYINRMDSAGTVNVQAVTSVWNEGKVTYATLPGLGSIAQTAQVAQSGAYVAMDVTGLVQGWVTNPSTNFGVALNAATAVFAIDSKENDLTGHPATLEVALASQGPQGPAGVAGPAGIAGPVGAAGPAGAPGPAGVAGPVGLTGPVGPAGGAGSAGAVGPAGPAGVAGPAGAAGATGTSGPQGLPGPVGGTGAMGLPGPAGAQGPQGVAGATGAMGPVGAAGPAGPAGANGAIGATGPAGPMGAPGAPGVDGAAGPVGLTFRGEYASTTNYAAGDGVMFGGAGYVSTKDSNHGNVPDQSPGSWKLFAAAGAAGAPGATGAAGPPGPAGPMGAAGASGRTGAVGPAGVQGPPALTYRGNYSATTNYTMSDAVSYGGSTYVSLLGFNVGNTPDQSPLNWAVLAAQGPQGATGAIGPPGAAGSAGANGVAGPAGPPATFLGQWLQTRSYAVGSAVSYGGGSYVALSGNVGREPDLSSSVWGLLAAAGASGSNGPQGPAGAEGPMGYPGPAGAMGATGPSGPIGPAGVNWRGGYSPNAVYSLADGVSYGGSSYVSLTSGSMGNEPDLSPSTWELLAQAGAMGTAGPMGLQGVPGSAGGVGAPGARGPAGPAGMTFRGAWTPGLNYTAGDAVTLNGSTYLAIAASAAVEPDQNASLWTVVSAAGAPGPSGSAGAAATVAVGSVTTGSPGSSATVVNVGTGGAAVLDFTIPQGVAGLPGTGGPVGEATMGSGSMVHLVSYAALFYGVNNTNQSSTEVASVLTWVPNGCTATELQVFSEQGGTITVTLRVGATPRTMAATNLSCQAATGGSCTATGSVNVPAGGFVDLGVANADSVAQGVWTAVSCH